MAGEVAAIAVGGRWLKHTFPGSLPLPERDPAPDNRWQRGDIVDALYLADREETAWAEWYRHLAERMIPPLAQMPRELWGWEVDVEVADLSSAERLAAVGLPPPAPGRATWPACQQVGERLHEEGWPACSRPARRCRRAGSSASSATGGGVPGATPVPPPHRVTEPPAPPQGLQT